MNKPHITSLVRGPGGRYKSTEGALSAASFVIFFSPESSAGKTISNLSFSSEKANFEVQVEYLKLDEFRGTYAQKVPTTTDVSDVELIPILNFISNQHQISTRAITRTRAASKTSSTTKLNAPKHVAACYFKDAKNYEDKAIERCSYTVEHDDSAFRIESSFSEESISLDRLSAANEKAGENISDPTSSISNEMASSSNTASKAATTLATETAITTSNDDSTIEEEIEEAIVISEELEASTGTGTDVDEHSEGIAVFPSTSKEIVDGKNAKSHVDLFGMDDYALSTEGSGEDSKHDEKQRSQPNEPFKIDDEQLSGGGLAQHFVIADDDDDDDDEDDEDEDEGDDGGKDHKLKSPEMTIHSRHELTTRSTDEDVSDFFEEEYHPNENYENEGEVHSSSIQLESVENILSSDPISDVSSDRSEKDHSIEEMIASNHSIVVAEPDLTNHTFVDDKKLDANAGLGDKNDDAELQKEVPTSTMDVKVKENFASLYVALSSSSSGNNIKSIAQFDSNKADQATIDNDDEDESSLELLKLRILALKYQEQQQTKQKSLDETSTSPAISSEVPISNYSSTASGSDQQIKPLERVPMSEFSKEILEDITEESERNSVSNATSPGGTLVGEQSLPIETEGGTIVGAADAHADDGVYENIAFETTNAVLSSDVMKTLPNDSESLNSPQTEKFQQSLNQKRRESNGISHSSEQPCSGLDNNSLVTNSTEYRTLQEDFAAANADLYSELTKRDELIATLNESLQQSLRVREQLQQDIERLQNELQAVRNLHNDINLNASVQPRAPNDWLRADQESNGGQRISEISMDLISESDDELERSFLTDNDNDDKLSRNSRERQLSVPRQMPEASDFHNLAIPSPTMTFSKQLEQFQQYLTTSEVRLFGMVQKKFDDFFTQELEKCRVKCENLHKIAMDRLKFEKYEKEQEIQCLTQARENSDALHSKEMEDLRKYFETKCAELEKQYSDDVFSQKSQRHDAESSSESSDAERMPEEVVIANSSHSVIAGNLVSLITNTSPLLSKDNSPRKRTRAELLLSPSHRQMTPCSDAIAGELKDSNLLLELQSFYQEKLHEHQRSHEVQMRKLNEKLKYFERRYPEDDFTKSDEDAQAKPKDILSQTADSEQLQLTDTTDGSQNPVNQSANASLIIIDQDKLNLNNESQVIQKIVEEYERRLQEQLNLARQDIVLELERQIQNLLSETTADDLHWPPELILLREKLTAKSQLEIAQLQMKHEEEMSRAKQDFEKQRILQRQKTMRRSIYEMGHDTLLAQVSNERDQLRQLLISFHHALSGLAKCVEVCEDEANATLNEQVQRLLLNFSIEQPAEQQSELQLNLRSSINMFNSFGTARLLPDVQTLLEVVDSPTLVQFINNNDDKEAAIEFNLKECLDRLNEEANYILELTEQRNRLRNEKAGNDKFNTSSDVFASPLKPLGESPSHRLRFSSLKEDNERYFVHVHNSMPADLRFTHPDELEAESGQNNPLHVQTEIAKLKTRLLESENDRQKLKQELENTISRNAELGQELQSLRDRISQLNSLNHIDFDESYGLELGLCPDAIKTSGEVETNQNLTYLLERARHILSSPPNNMPLPSVLTKQDNPHDESRETDKNHYSTQLLQLIEDFCRESYRLVDSHKRERGDLKAQIEAADQKIKSTRKFVEEQAAEREQERDEFTREIERQKCLVRDKEKDIQNILNKSRELEQLVSQVNWQKDEITTTKQQRDKMEEELKASISKIFDLREIIAELESRIEEKEVNERIMVQKLEELNAYIHSQNHSNETLKNEVISLKTEIDTSYHERIRALERKLQSVRPTAEQFAIMGQVVEQLHEIEDTLDQKTKMLESFQHSASSNSSSQSATEDVSAQGAVKRAAIASVQKTDIALDSPSHSGSPVHPSPRQHSLTLEGVQRVIDKLAKHTRVEEAALKRIRDLEMQVSQMCTAGVELQQERDTLQERLSEQSQRISALQMRLDEQRRRADDLQRIGTSDLNIRIHDLQSEVNGLIETLSARDKQMAAQKQQLENSKKVINRLEAELVVTQQPDRSTIGRLENELSAKQQEIQKLKNMIKNDMINKQHLPDLMETMLADKNDEIDLLRQQYEMKIKELSAPLDISVGHSLCIPSHSDIDIHAGGDAQPRRDQRDGKLTAHMLSDIVSMNEDDAPDALRRAAISMNQQATPLNIANHSMETSKEVVYNLTQKRTVDLTGNSCVHAPNTFDDPRYFLQEPQKPSKITLTNSTDMMTPQMQPRQINFSELSEDSKLKSKETELDEHLSSLEKELQVARLQLANMQKQLQDAVSENVKAELEEAKLKLAEEKEAITLLKTENDKLVKERDMKSEMLTKCEKDMENLYENESKLKQRIQTLEAELLLLNQNEQQQILGAEQRKFENEQLNAALKAKETRVEELSEELKASEACIEQLNSKLCKSNEQIALLQQVTERQRQQLNSDNSSKLISVEEIAQQVEKELYYSAHLDSKILKAIESEEENNLNVVHLDKSNQTSAQEEGGMCAAMQQQQQQATDDENFAGERELLNQLEVLRAQITFERERNEIIRRELLAEKQNSQDVQQQDIAVLSALRKRLEKAMKQEDELHKVLDLERKRFECLNAQYTALQRAESRRNSAVLLKSPTDSPRKGAAERTARSLGDFESDLAERLRIEIKLLTAQNERERERSADLQRNSEREFARYKNELEERKEYCQQLNREMTKLQRERDAAQQDCENLQERLTLQSQEIESLEWRLATIQEAESQRAARRESYHKQTLELQAEIQELKTHTFTIEAEMEASRKLTAQLRTDLERSKERERNQAEALSQARENFAVTTPSEESVPLRLLQNEIEVKRQMAETLQLLTEERCCLQRKCDELESQIGNRSAVEELEERCKQILGRYLRVESHRKALIYQKQYLKVSLLSYITGERCLAVLRRKDEDYEETELKRNRKKLFKTVGFAIIAIHRMKYIVNTWRSGKRIVSNFKITQQRRAPVPSIVAPNSFLTVAAASSTTPNISTSAPWPTSISFVSKHDVVTYNNNKQNSNKANFNNYDQAKSFIKNGKVN